jgi:polar amino acid transport system substrate-binding protein
VLPDLAAKKFDLAIAPVSITAERLKRYALTVPIAEATTALLRRADDASIARPQDIAGKTVGGQKGAPQTAQLQAFAQTLRTPATVKEYSDAAQGLDDLTAGRLDAVADALPSLAYAAARHAGAFALVLPPFGRPSYYCWAGRRGPDDQTLTEAVSAALLKLQDDGRFAAIQTKWFGLPMALPRTVPDAAV